MTNTVVLPPLNGNRNRNSGSNTNNTNNTNNSSSGNMSEQLAEQSLQVLREMERLLFFTDVPENEDDALFPRSTSTSSRGTTVESYLADQTKSTSESGGIPLNTLFELESALSKSLSLTTNEGESKTSHSRDDYEQQQHDDYGKQLLSLPNMNAWTPELAQVMELLKAQLEAALKSASATAKEMERQVFFTDLPDRSTTNSSKSNSKRNKALTTRTDKSSQAIQMQRQLEAVLHQLQAKLQQAMERAAATTTQTYQQCERAILFTDVPDNHTLLTSDKGRTKQDVVQHFENNQQVFQELKRKFLFTDL